VKAGRTLGLQIGDPFWTALADGKATNCKSL
jgi:hypothetical protein